MSLPRYCFDDMFAMADTKKKNKRIYGQILKKQFNIDADNKTNIILTVQCYQYTDLVEPTDIIDIEITNQLAKFVKEHLATKDVIMADGYILQPNYNILYIDKKNSLFKMENEKTENKKSDSFSFKL